jgi:ADP-ribose pyrophosphatase
MARVWQGRFIEVRAEPYGEDGVWEYVGRVRQTGAAVILALHEEAIVLVEQFRVPLGARTIELPAGLIGDEASDEAAPEAAVLAAARELEEETGWRAQIWEPLGDFATSPGMSSEMFSLFRARSLVRTGPGGGVAGEDILPHLVPLAELGDFLATKRAEGMVIDCRLGLALGLV